MGAIAPISGSRIQGAMDEAVRHARGKIREHAERRPPRGWGYLDGAELAVRGSGGSGDGRLIQIARARVKQWSPRVERRFLTALAATCNVKAACAEVGMSATSAYNHRHRWLGFAKLWDEAIEIGYTRIEFGLLAHGGNQLPRAISSGRADAGNDRERRDPPAAHAQAPGARHRQGARQELAAAAEPDDPEIRESIFRKLDVIERIRLAREAGSPDAGPLPPG